MKPQTKNEDIIPISKSTAVHLNPGTGDVLNATEVNAEENMIQFIKDIGIPNVYYTNDNYEEGGRYYFTLHFGVKEIEIEMPGNKLENVRYLDNSIHDPWLFPRLYVDGSSWLWKYAVSSVQDYFNGLFDEED